MFHFIFFSSLYYYYFFLILIIIFKWNFCRLVKDLIYRGENKKNEMEERIIILTFLDMDVLSINYIP